MLRAKMRVTITTIKVVIVIIIRKLAKKKVKAV